MEKLSDLEPLTVSVPEAGRMLGIGKAAAYAAAHRSQIPTIRMGRLLRVPRRAIEVMLERAASEMIDGLPHSHVWASRECPKKGRVT
jgi:excisionase family DNA binding protein